MKPLLLLFFCSAILWADAHIFVYHRFNDSRHPSTNTSNEDLRRDFDYFKNNGYKIVSLEELVQKVKTKENIPDNWVVLTIDDNYKSFYEYGLPIFKEYNYPFSLFVFVEGTHREYPDYTTWEELQEISQHGSIEFHSYAHKHMTHMSNEEIKKDFDKGMNLIKEHLGITPKYFSYPYGEFSQRVKEFTKAYGFEAIINQNMGAVASFSDVYDLDRTALVGKSNLKHLLDKKALHVTWSEPSQYPEDKIIKKVQVITSENSEHGKIYLSGYGWMDVTLQDGNFDTILNKELKFERSRVIVSIGNKISNKLIIKDSYGTK
jgi:peptidoglycan/xylan/chitin deacetylase (PgdA/CDA1 family)